MSEDALDRKAVERFAGNVTHGLLKAVPEADLFAMLSEPEYDGLKRSILDAGKINMPIHILRYVGVCGTGRALEALIRVYVACLCAAQTVFEAEGATADPLMTLVGYFNSIRGARAGCGD